MTHFGPPQDQAALKFTAQCLPIALGFFETLLAVKYPYPSLQQAFLPAKFNAIASAGLQLLPSSLLFTERCLEHVSPYKAEWLEVTSEKLPELCADDWWGY